MILIHTTEKYFFGIVAYGLSTRLKNLVFNKFMRMPMNFYDDGHNKYFFIKIYQLLNYFLFNIIKLFFLYIFYIKIINNKIINKFFIIL